MADDRRLMARRRLVVDPPEGPPPEDVDPADVWRWLLTDQDPARFPGAAPSSSSEWITPGDVWVATDLRPTAPQRAAPRGTSIPRKSDLLGSWDAAQVASKKPMYPGGPAPALFGGARQREIRAFFSSVDDRVRRDERFADLLAHMCRGDRLDEASCVEANRRFAELCAKADLALDSADLPPGVIGTIAEKFSKVRFYPASFGTGKWIGERWHEGILTWKKGKNGLSAKLKNGFAPGTHKDSPLCMGDGPYKVLEIVIELHKGAFRLGVIERDANGGSRHSDAALAMTLSGKAGKDIVDGQLFLAKNGQWLPRTTVQGPMLTKHGLHVPRQNVLEIRRPMGDGRTHVEHYWDVFGAAGGDYVLLSPKGRVIPITEWWALNIVPSEDFKAVHPGYELVKLVRHAGRNL